MANTPVEGDSTVRAQAGVTGRSSAPRGTAILGTALDGYSITGQGKGVEGHGLIGVHGESTHGIGVHGVFGGLASEDGQDSGGVVGESKGGVGVKGVSASGTGVIGESFANGAIGVYGQNDNGGTGVSGSCDAGTGVLGRSLQGNGVSGTSGSGSGVSGESKESDGVFGTAHFGGKSGVVGIHTGDGHGVYGRASAPGFAGWFDGNVTVSGDIFGPNGTVHCYDVNVGGGDCAEDFDICGSEPIPPGTVMVLDSRGMLKPSVEAYDKKVAGILSGAGDYKPGIVLDKRHSGHPRMPLALMGKAYCRVDATYGPIEVGDLLTTSPTLGCAMKANEPHKAFGAVIGKALRPLQTGLGLIPVLVALQ